MPVFETYASRLVAATKAGAPDVYIYNKLPPFLRKQVSLIFDECIASASRDWAAIAKIMNRDVETFAIRTQYPSFNCMEYLRTSQDV
jgi:hypothetical protein